MKFKFSALLSTGALFLATTASATTLVAYPEQNVTVNEGSIAIDFAGLDGLGETDGQADIIFGVTANLANGSTSSTNEVVIGEEFTIGSSRVLSVSVALSPDEADADGPVQLFAGDIVDDRFVFSENPFFLYDDFGILPEGFGTFDLEVGQTTFLGLKVTQFERIVRELPEDIDPSDTGIFEFSEGGLGLCFPEEAVCITSREVSVNFGFLELTRGSLTPGRLGFELSGAAAVIPDDISAVPLPASGFFLFGALTGLAGFRRRKAAK